MESGQWGRWAMGGAGAVGVLVQWGVVWALVQWRLWGAVWAPGQLEGSGVGQECGLLPEAPWCREVLGFSLGPITR